MVEPAVNKLKDKRRLAAAEVRAGICPYCGKRGFYNISLKYQRCQCCGLYRVVAPWSKQ